MFHLQNRSLKFYGKFSILYRGGANNIALNPSLLTQEYEDFVGQRVNVQSGNRDWFCNDKFLITNKDALYFDYIQFISLKIYNSQGEEYADIVQTPYSSSYAQGQMYLYKDDKISEEIIKTTGSGMVLQSYKKIYPKTYASFNDNTDMSTQKLVQNFIPMSNANYICMQFQFTYLQSGSYKDTTFIPTYRVYYRTLN